MQENAHTTIKGTKRLAKQHVQWGSFFLGFILFFFFLMYTKMHRTKNGKTFKVGRLLTLSIFLLVHSWVLHNDSFLLLKSEKILRIAAIRLLS